MKHYKLSGMNYRVTDNGEIQCRTSSEHDWVTSSFESESDLISNGAVLVEPSKAMHSPTPWREKYNRVFITGDNGTILLTVDSIALMAEEDRANAAHIVRCVNAHEELLEALERTSVFALELMDQAAKIDRMLLEAKGQPWEIERGEIVRLRQQLGRNRAAINKATK